MRRNWRFSVWLAVLVPLLLAGCAATPGSQTAGVRQLEFAGDSDHFPRHVDPFVRTQIIAYGVGTEDVSIGYNSTVGEKPSGTTLYLYPVYRPQKDAATTLEFEFEQVKSVMARFPGGSWIVRRGQAVVNQPSGPVEGLTATYQYKAEHGGRQVELHTVLHLFLEGNRLIKFRHTYPAVDAEFYRTVIDDLMSSLRWLGTTPENMEARLSQPT
jgi:hypothetical protein